MSRIMHNINVINIINKYNNNIKIIIILHIYIYKLINFFLNENRSERVKLEIS